MTVWQDYLFSRFSRDTYTEVPEHARGHNWRHATWDAFVKDTVDSFGTQMATILSMAYRPKVIVEMGLDAGFTTLQFCRLNPQARVYGVDMRSKDHSVNLPVCFHALMNDVDNLTLAITKSWDFSMPQQVGLCFIDACHTGDAPWKDTLRAWDNRNVYGDWCIAWDDYHPSNPDVKSAVDQFTALVGMELHQVGSWFYIGTIPHEVLKQYGCTT